MNVEAAAIGAGQGVGGGLAIWAVLRFIRWLTEFVAERLDKRNERLDEREKDIEQRFNDRLRHAEDEVARLQQAVAILLQAIAENDPKNPAVAKVAQILGALRRTPQPDAELDELVRKAGRAIDGAD